MIYKFLLIVLFIIISLNSAFSQTKANPNIEQAEQILNQALEEKNPEKRKEAVIALSLEGNLDEVFPLLAKASTDSDVNVRVAACLGLAETKDKRAITALETALNDEIPEVSFAAAQALWQMNQKVGKDALVAVLEGEQPTSSSYFSKQKRDTMRMMKNPAGLFRFALKTGIGFIPVPGIEAGFNSMQALTKNVNLSGRALAALLLAKDSSPDSLKPLEEALTDRDWSVRAAAIHAIALRNDIGARNELVALFEDKKEQVRYRAAAAYLRLEKMKTPQHKVKKRK
jgi:HEAT repeat protein